MNLNNYNVFRSYLKSISEIISIILVIIGIIFLFGWAFDIMILKSPGPRFSTIKSNVALCFILIGVSLWLQQTKRVNKRNKYIAQILAFIVLLIGLITIIEYIFNFNFRIDQLLFPEPPGALNTYSPNRMAFIAAVELIITGTALLILDKKIHKHVPAQYLMIIEGTLALIIVLGYLYGVSELYRVHYYTATAIYAGIGFILIFFAFLAARPDEGFMKVLTGEGYGSIFGRKILIAILVIPIVLGWLWIIGQNLGYYDAAFGNALYTISVLIILTVLVWNSMVSLNKIDRERQKANEELEKNLEDLELSNKELQSFAFITSHDLQEPLRSIASYAQLIQGRYKGKLDPDADEFIEYMVSGAKRMKTMIQGLIDYSRVGAQNNEFKGFSTEQALNNALSNLSISIEKCNAEITYDSFPVIFANIDQITSVFQNLIGNALKFRKKDEKLKIHISVKKGDDEWIFSVSDNGIGIEEQYSSKIFEVFKRLHSIGEYQGVGIGLAIVKRIIDRHNGRIWVESQFGKGSTFFFTIPFKTD